MKTYGREPHPWLVNVMIAVSFPFMLAAGDQWSNNHVVVAEVVET